MRPAAPVLHSRSALEQKALFMNIGMNEHINQRARDSALQLLKFIHQKVDQTAELSHSCFEI
jgi:hypothetical protein